MSFYSDLENFGDSLAIAADDGTQLSYSELAATADAFSSRMEAPRPLVFILCENTWECVAAYLGCLRSCAVPLLVAAGINQSLLDGLIDCYRPNYIFGPTERVQNGERLGRCSLKAAFSEPSRMLPELSLLLSTSGSTGSPRLVRLSGSNLETNARSIAQYLHLDEHERPLTLLPMHYSYGLSVLNSHLLVGASIALSDKSVMQRELWEFAKASDVTSVSGVPYTYAMLKRLRFFRKDTLPSVRTFTQAGGGMDAALTAEVADFCETNGKELYVMYGQTEATARMSYVPPTRLREKMGSIGMPIPGGNFTLDRLADDVSGREHVSELIYEGPNVMLGYAASASDLAKPDINCGVLATGDVAWRDSEGFYYLVGRKKRFIKIFGNRVGLDEVEHRLAAEGMFVAATGRDDKLLIACEDGTSPAAVEEALARLFGLNRAAYDVRAVSVVPRNEAGKIQYESLLELFVAQS